MEIGYFAAVMAHFRQIIAQFGCKIEGARMVVIDRGRRFDSHVLPRRRYAHISLHARRRNTSGAFSFLSQHRDPARTQGVECSSHRVAASATSRSEKRRPPEATRQSGKAFGHNSVTLIRCVLSAVSEGAPPRRTWSITSRRTAATWCCFGIKTIGKRFARPAIAAGSNGLKAAQGGGGPNPYRARDARPSPRALISCAFLAILS